MVFCCLALDSLLLKVLGLPAGFCHFRDHFFMALLEKHLIVKKSLIPGAGKGLFTKVPIKKGTWIVEYKGEILTWKEVEKMADDRNGYVFFVFSTHVIDAWKYKKAKARFANDARGIVRIPGVTNNCEYYVFHRRCYIKAVKNIPAGSEIFVDYGREYWQAIRYNIREELKKAKSKKAKPKLPHQDANRKSTRKK